MPAIGLHDDVFDKVRLLPRAWGITEGEVVSRLLNEFQRSERRSTESGTHHDGIPIYAIYDGVRVEGTFDATTNAVSITGGVLAGQLFRSPSGAAVAVVGAINPAVKPNRSGWSFWTLADSGQLLHTIRHG